MTFHDKASLRFYRRELRKNPTPQEEKLWKHIRRGFLGVKFCRQHSLGNFIVDFYCPSKRLIIEIDGGVHRESKARDEVRDDYFKNLNFKVIRFWNNKIDTDIDNVIEQIKNILISC